MRMRLLFFSLLLASMGWGQIVGIGERVEYVFTAVWIYEDGRVAPMVGAPVECDALPVTGSGFHYHTEPDRPKPWLNPFRGVTNGYGEFEFTALMPSFSGAYAIRCTGGGTIRQVFAQAGIWSLRGLANSWENEMSGAYNPPPSDYRHGSSPRYSTGTVGAIAVSFARSMQELYLSGMVDFLRMSLPTGGTLDDNFLTPWRSGDPHMEGKEFDFTARIDRVVQASAKVVIGMLATYGCICSPTDFGRYHVYCPGMIKLPAPPPGLPKMPE